MDDCSSEWSYFAPYEADIGVVLQRLREDVFAREDYMTSSSPIYAGKRLIIPHERPRPKPATIEELLEQEGGSGTHSILDMTCISLKPKRKAISPFPNSSLLDYFDSETPSPAEIQEVYEFGSLEKFVSKRWRGIYIIGYFDGKPSDIFFAGSSGD
jgi:hypothetical protein